MMGSSGHPDAVSVHHKSGTNVENWVEAKTVHKTAHGPKILSRVKLARPPVLYLYYSIDLSYQNETQV